MLNAARNASSTISSRPSFSAGTSNFAAQSAGVPGSAGIEPGAFQNLT